MSTRKIRIRYFYTMLTVLLLYGCSSTHVIITNPVGAIITVNKVKKGLSPFFVKYSNIWRRNVALTVQKEGYKTINTNLDTKEGKIVSFNLQKSKEGAIVASVNNKYISKSSLEALEKEVSQRSRGQSFRKEKLLDELIQRELLIQDATRKQLDQTPEFNEQLATIKESLLSQAAVQNYLKTNEVTDADLRAEYDSKVPVSGEEYKARHILVKSEDEAKAIIEELKKGADFVELAKKKSTGPSGPKGGDLGWFSPDTANMAPPFSKAVVALEDNKFTTEVVKTKFGYHVILREGSRANTSLSFDSVKEQIRPDLQRKKVQGFLTDLRAEAKVEIFLEKETSVPKLTKYVNHKRKAKKSSTKNWRDPLAWSFLDVVGAVAVGAVVTGKVVEVLCGYNGKRCKKDEPIKPSYTSNNREEQETDVIENRVKKIEKIDAQGCSNILDYVVGIKYEKCAKITCMLDEKALFFKTLYTWQYKGGKGRWITSGYGMHSTLEEVADRVCNQ